MLLREYAWPRRYRSLHYGRRVWVLWTLIFLEFSYEWKRLLERLAIAVIIVLVESNDRRAVARVCLSLEFLGGVWVKRAVWSSPPRKDDACTSLKERERQAAGNNAGKLFGIPIQSSIRLAAPFVRINVRGTRVIFVPCRATRRRSRRVDRNRDLDRVKISACAALRGNMFLCIGFGSAISLIGNWSSQSTFESNEAFKFTRLLIKLFIAFTVTQDHYKKKKEKKSMWCMWERKREIEREKGEGREKGIGIIISWII